MAHEAKHTAQLTPQQQEAFLQTMIARHSVRGFLKDKDVPKEIIDKVLEAARYYPSSSSTQPVKVSVVRGAAIKKLSKLLLEAEARKEYIADYETAPTKDKMAAHMLENTSKWGKEYFEHIGVVRDDLASRHQQIIRNLEFYDAPVTLVVSLPENSVGGTYLDGGAYVYGVMLACHALGLGSLAQYCTAMFSPVVKKFCKLDEKSIVLCGVAIGYEDPDAISNRGFRAHKVPLEKVVTYIDDVDDETVTASEDATATVDGHAASYASEASNSA